MNIIPCKLNKSKTLNPINRRNIVKSTLNAFRKLSFQTNIQHLQTLLYCMGARSKWHTTIPRFSYIHMHLNPGHRWIESDLKYYSICICTNIIPSRELYSLRSFLRIGLLWAHIFIAFILFSKCLAAIALKPNLVEISSINNISRTHTHTHTIEIEHKLCYSIYMKTTEYYNLYIEPLGKLMWMYCESRMSRMWTQIIICLGDETLYYPPELNQAKLCEYMRSDDYSCVKHILSTRLERMFALLRFGKPYWIKLHICFIRK